MRRNWKDLPVNLCNVEELNIRDDMPAWDQRYVHAHLYTMEKYVSVSGMR